MPGDDWGDSSRELKWSVIPSLNCYTYYKEPNLLVLFAQDTQEVWCSSQTLDTLDNQRVHVTMDYMRLQRRY